MHGLEGRATNEAEGSRPLGFTLALESESRVAEWIFGIEVVRHVRFEETC